MKRILLIILFALPLSIYAETNSPPETNPKKLFSLELRTGFIGTTWSPQGLDPYVVDTYSRSMMYAELKLAHPLFVVNEAFDFISFPSLRIDSNMGYSSESGDFGEMIPSFIAENPYIRTIAWMTFFEDISFRYRHEKFVVGLQEQPISPIDGAPQKIYHKKTVTNSIKDIEIGFIATVDNDSKTTLELGYYRRYMNWPFIEDHYSQSMGSNYKYLNHRSIWMSGAYGAAHLNMSWAPLPIGGQIYLYIGDILGFDLRMKYESKSSKRVTIGFETEISSRMFTNYHDSSIFEKETRTTTPSEMRIRVSFFAKFDLI